jgi:nucleoside-diphosphate-sugar epimerase
MKAIYATGTSGTIGKHLPSQIKPLTINLASSEQEFANLSISAESNLIHLAGIVGPQAVSGNIEFSKIINIRGTIFLANEFLRKSDGIFFYISTSHVYKPTTKEITESSALEPVNIYASQKLEAEIALLSLFKSTPNRLCIVRLFSVLDWDVAPFTLGGAVRKLTDSSSEFILSNSSDIRDFLTPKMIASALFEMASRDLSLGVVNLCTNQGTSVGLAAQRMLAESGFEVPATRFTWGNSNTPFVVGSNSRLISAFPNLDLTWQPSTLN